MDIPQTLAKQDTQDTVRRQTHNKEQKKTNKQKHHAQTPSKHDE